MRYRLFGLAVALGGVLGCAAEPAPELAEESEPLLGLLGGDGDSFEGLCDISGVLDVEVGSFDLFPSYVEFHVTSTGTCTGLLNGQLVIGEPVSLTASAAGPGSCTIELLPGSGTATFPGAGAEIDFDLVLSTAILLTGKDGGSFVGEVNPEDWVEFITTCLPPGFTQIGFQARGATVLPLRG